MSLPRGSDFGSCLDIFIIESKCGSKGYCMRADTVSSVCPPPLSQMSDFVFLAICSHCAALPDRRHSERLGSVNCKGMWHSFLKLQMFRWILRADFCQFSTVVFGESVSGADCVYPKLQPWLAATDWTPAKIYIGTSHIYSYLFYGGQFKILISTIITQITIKHENVTAYFLTCNMFVLLSC